MSSSLKERIVKSWIMGILLFVSFTIMYKLVIPREDWFELSIMMTTSWTIGFFVSKSIVDAKEDLNIENAFLLNVTISIVVLVVMVFVFCVFISSPNSDYIVSNICIPFAISMLIYSIGE